MSIDYMFYVNYADDHKVLADHISKLLGKEFKERTSISHLGTEYSFDLGNVDFSISQIDEDIDGPDMGNFREDFGFFPSALIFFVNKDASGLPQMYKVVFDLLKNFIFDCTLTIQIDYLILKRVNNELKIEETALNTDDGALVKKMLDEYKLEHKVEKMPPLF